MSDTGKPVDNGAGVMRLAAAQQPPVLTARAAAAAMRRRTLTGMLKRLLQRMLLSGTVARHLPAWTPLLLRWARKALAVGSPGTVRAPVLQASTLSRFHWHLHLTAFSGARRERREAPAADMTRPIQLRVPAGGMNPAGARRKADIVYRRLYGRAGATEGARTMPAYLQPPGIGAGRVAAPPERAERAQGGAKASPAAGTARTASRHRWQRPLAVAWKAAPAPGAGRVSVMRRPQRAQVAARRGPPAADSAHMSARPRWPDRGTVQTGWVRTDTDSRPAQVPHALAVLSFLALHDHPRGAKPIGRARAALRDAPAAPRPAPVPVAFRSPMQTPAATSETRRPAYAQVQAGREGGIRHTRRQAAGTVLWAQRGHPPAVASPSRRPAAPHPSKSGIAARRQVDLVWPASATGTASPGNIARPDHIARPDPAAAQGASSGRAAPAVASAPAAPAVVPAATPAPATPGRAGAGAVMQVTVLDPAVANRLADEVIRRIDDRARIARERRGL